MCVIVYACLRVSTFMQVRGGIWIFVVVQFMFLQVTITYKSLRIWESNVFGTQYTTECECIHGCAQLCAWMYLCTRGHLSVEGVPELVHVEAVLQQSESQAKPHVGEISRHPFLPRMHAGLRCLHLVVGS